MTRAETAGEPLAKSIFVDEIGIETGLLGDVRINTTYQPVYAGGDSLTPVMLRAGVDVANNAWPVHPTGNGLPSPASPDGLRRMSALLALRNYRNADLQGMDLYLDAASSTYGRAAEFLADVRQLAREADELEIEPHQVICELDTQASDDEAVAHLARVVRRAGARIAIAHGQPDDRLTTWMANLRPDFVRIDRNWLARILRHEPSRLLLSPLIHAMRESGASVLFEGLDTPHSFAAARQSGANFFQGNCLHKAGLAGTLIDPVSMAAASLQTPPNVIRMQAAASRRRSE